MRLQDLIDELERQKPLKWDQKIESSNLGMVLDGSPKFQLDGRENLFTITRPCHNQIAERLEIPVRYYSKMDSEAPELLIENVNTWLKKNSKEVFVRGLGNSVRAFLSDRYRVIDHPDVLYCSLNELQAYEADVEDCYLSETEMNVKVKSNQLKDFVRHKEDLIIGGLLLVNSETGHRALRVEPRMFRVKCTNGMVIEEFLTRQIHLGNGNEVLDEMVYLSIRRSIKELFGRFGEIIQVLRETTEIKVKSPQRVINNVVEHYRLSEEQKENILIAFGAEPEYDKYGIANAVTRAAKNEENWEKSLDLERIGGRLITISTEEFKNWDE
ncbi:MAG: hypothetical protein AUJ18_02385 [Candidatus Hydrogenedentes bacterium CG1_02_42_14]|uniref:DUF932 domain-containing protein n=2 Tax=Candidatus Shapironibacteriota TaxID=1752721 RepID=A0A2M8ETN3_9BACT|nr:MAG: hypothetical protein AUJ18_02385 [Candidatus Hydrogenedentes bacterium CG1_02_42_14]PJC28487.1 MAG: hypothetical protein CO053_04390 [Candidatus Shapirobacteria bacterium CG_4_9_14_0_2_um_filter_40_11]